MQIGRATGSRGSDDGRGRPRAIVPAMTNGTGTFTRRRLLAAGAGLAAAGTAGASLAGRLLRTLAQTEGPFYPDRLPLDTDNDLLRLDGRGATARGEPTEVTGRVLDTDGRPLPGVRVEIWQCDALGYYHHVKEYSGGDPNFQGYGRTVAAEDGGYRFRTIKPVPYRPRTPHIHFKLSGRGIDGLTTQLYVAGHPLNAEDFIYGRLPAAAREWVTVPFRAVEGRPGVATAARFDIVLGRTPTDG